jgi:hypothetical protein
VAEGGKRVAAFTVTGDSSIIDIGGGSHAIVEDIPCGCLAIEHSLPDTHTTAV